MENEEMAVHEEEITPTNEQENNDQGHEESAPVDTNKDKNLRALRESKERAERERDEAYKILKQIEEARRGPTPPEEEDEELGLKPEDLVEGKHLNRYEKKIRKMEDRLKQYEQQSNLSSAEMKLKSKYSDFDKVVSLENVTTLREMYPEIAETLRANSNIYSQGVSAYTLIKNLGIHQEDTTSAERETVRKNASKPRSLTSISPQQGDTPLSRANAFANGLTEDLKDQLRKEMYEAMKNN